METRDITPQEGVPVDGVQEGQVEEPEFRGPEFFDENELSPLPKEEKNLSPDERSSRHFQSLYDKSQAELTEVRQQLSQVQQYLLMQQQAQQQTQGQPPSSGQPRVNPQSAAGEYRESLQKPERPTRPHTYDPIDATTDPNSDSWKYREAMDDYRERMVDYMAQAEERTMQRAEAVAQRQAYEMRAQGIRSQLSTTYGMSDQEVQEFWQMMDDPSVMTLDNLVRFYRGLRGAPSQGTPQRPRNKMPLPPVPTSSGRAGQEAQSGNPTDRIMDDMLRQYNGLSINE